MEGAKKRLHAAGDGAERNGRQRKRGGRSEEALSPASEEIEYRLLCPRAKVGSVIGKGGSVIEALRVECNCKIKVEDLVAESEERVVRITSASDQVKQASQYTCGAQEALFKVYARVTDPYDDQEDESGQVIVRLLVPKSHSGCVIGKGGKVIEQMRKETGAQIRILSKEQLPTCASDSDELVQIAGNEPTVRRALLAVSTRLYENVTGERFSGSHFKQGSGAFPILGTGSLLYPSSDHLTPTGSSLYGLSSMGGPVGGLGHSFPAYGGLYGESGLRSLSSGAPEKPGVRASSGYGHTDGASEEQLIVRILCPKFRIGNIIGKGGSAIKKMREDTGAKIKVEDEVPDCDERIIRVSSTESGDGPSQSIQAALGVYQRLAELQLDKERDNHSFVVRLLVPSNQIGCLIGKGGSVVTEMRKITKANIRISPKDEPSKCAEEDDALVQIAGDQIAVYDALLQILNRLQNNLFKGQDNRDSGLSRGSSGLSYSGSAYLGASYPLTNVGTQYGFGGYESSGVRTALPELAGRADAIDSRSRRY